MRRLDVKDLSTPEIFQLLLGGVSPRPIALVATISEDGILNIAPFSFFNAFGANPPIVAFSPSSRVRDGSKKNTYYNLKKTKECSIQAVSYEMVEQTNLASNEYPASVNEFIKAGFTPVESDLIKVPRVKESPFQMECKLIQIVELGAGKGSGNLMICEVLKFHVAEDIFENGVIVPRRIDLVGRGSGNWYARANGHALFELEKPGIKQGVGYENLPEHVKKSNVLTANNLAKLAGIEKIPTQKEAVAFLEQFESKTSFDKELDLVAAFKRLQSQGRIQEMLAVALAVGKENKALANRLLEKTARRALDKNELEFAWKTVLSIG